MVQANSSHPPSCLPEPDDRQKARQSADRQGTGMSMLSVCPVRRQSTPRLARTIKPVMSRTLPCSGGPDLRPGGLAASSRRCWRMRFPPTRAAGLSVVARCSKRARCGGRVAQGLLVCAVRCPGSAGMVSGDGWPIATGRPVTCRGRAPAPLVRPDRFGDAGVSGAIYSPQAACPGRSGVGTAGVLRKGRKRGMSRVRRRHVLGFRQSCHDLNPLRTSLQAGPQQRRLFCPIPAANATGFCRAAWALAISC